uniref:Reverse transcriptase n=1 Tax=Strongyloides venezuelensis TaxID=75913 RepID=A0A0K0FP98_STRVS
MYYLKWLEETSKNDEVLHLYINSGMSVNNTKISLAAQEDQLMLKEHPANKSKDKSCRTCGDPLETLRHTLNYCHTYMSLLQASRHKRVMHIVGRFLAKKYKVEYAKIGENDYCKYTIDTPWPVDEKLHHHLPYIV